MTRPRKEQISISNTPYYHIVSRCVRRSFLCGTDLSTGKNYEHRRSWIEDRIRLLSSIFGIDICAYAVMSNHLHLVVQLKPARIESLSDDEIVQLWTCLYKGPLLVQRWTTGERLDQAERETLATIIEIYRNRLKDLGWFMKCLNEPIARQANKEDGCTGHFWEARYKSQALLTEEALLSCMAYVDLNPVRACMAETPENSDYTSIKERVEPTFDLTKAVQEQTELGGLLKFDVPLIELAKFEGAANQNEQEGILFSLDDYFSLVDYTARCVRPGKRGAITASLPPILERLNITQKKWLNNALNFERNYNSQFSRRNSSFRNSA